MSESSDFLAAKEIDYHPLFLILGEALSDAVGHLDYCGWGDSWERQGADEIEPKIREALERYEKLTAHPVTVEEFPEFPCPDCDRVFGSKSARRSHRKHSSICHQDNRATPRQPTNQPKQ